MAQGSESGVWRGDWGGPANPWRPPLPPQPPIDQPPLPPRPPEPPEPPEPPPPAEPPVDPPPKPPVSVTPVTKKTTSGSTKTETKYRTTKLQETVVHTVSDNGSGGLGENGTVNYAGKSVNLRLVNLNSTTDGYKSDHENSSAFDNSAAGGSSSTKGGEYMDNAMSEELLASSTVTVTYSAGISTEVTQHHTFTPPAVTIDLCPYTSDYVVPGSVRFTWMGQVFEDYDGVLIRARTAQSVGFVAGQMNYSTGIATVTDYVVGGPATQFTLDSLWTVRQNWNTASVFLRTQAAPLKPSGFVMNLVDSQGNNITATGDLDGNLTGAHMRGKIEYLTGIVELQFGDYVLDTDLTDEQKLEWWYSADDVGAVQPLKIWRPWPVDPTTLRYNTVAYFYLPIDAEILGLDPVRLPPDGRVPIYRVGSTIVLGHKGALGPLTVSNGQTINMARTRLARVRVVGSDGATINTGYTADLDAGTITAVDTTGWEQPVTIEHVVEQMARLRDVQIDGTLGIVGQLAHEFPVGTVVSSAIDAPTLRARVSQFFDQGTWDGITWSDSLVGNPAPATYNDTLAPVELTNNGALTERFALRFTNSTTFECIGEHVGFIGTGSINTDFAPVNAVGNAPYFTLRALGWGTGWAAGNVLFVHTVGAIYPFACIRTVQMGEPSGTDYSFELLLRGDVDRPPSTP